MNLDGWEECFRRFLAPRLGASDPAHDLGHVLRVVATARQLAAAEGADLEVVVPAAWLHDGVVAKDGEGRSRASAEAARVAADFLSGLGYSQDLVPAIHHAIEAHSFSAGVTPETLEAKVVQDADRLDALGAVGVARCFLVGGAWRRPLCNPVEPFPERRPADDSTWTLDHFFVKLLRLPATMQTPSGRALAERRAAFMATYLETLRAEIDLS